MAIWFCFPMFDLTFTIAVENRTTPFASVQFFVSWFWFITIRTEGGGGIDGRRRRRWQMKPKPKPNSNNNRVH